ncbi:MAG: acetolactate synthase large subunit [Burkholderiaceae bacterium]
MNGAQSLVSTLLACDVDTCFANPGTSEMHFVAALDSVQGMRCVLGLAETVVTGAADGYARMAGKPAVTLLHCGPGLANGLANIHNAKRAYSPMVNIVGDHAIHHRPYDTPLTSDVEGVARPFSHWVRTSMSAQAVGSDVAAAVQAARTPPGQIATLVLPADASWGEGGQVASALPIPQRQPTSPENIRAIARILRSKESALLMISGEALSENGLIAAQRVAQASGAQLLTPTQVPRMARGAGRLPVERLPYGINQALDLLKPYQHIVLVGAKHPAPFFAYPDRPSSLAAPGAQIHVLARPEQDLVGALQGLADELGAPATVSIVPAAHRPQIATGPFEAEKFASTLGALLPENCIVAEDAVTSGRPLFSFTHNAAPNDWLQLTGGAIGHGFANAIGAAIACPDRKVVCLQADGSGMYCVQALWTQARQHLDIVNVVFANRVYKILQGELVSVGAKSGPASNDLFDLGRPNLDWVKLANGMGVEACAVTTLEQFADVFKAACAKRGPFLIEFRI